MGDDSARQNTSMVKTLCCKIVGVLFALVSIIVPYVLHAEQGPSVAPRITETVDESVVSLWSGTHTRSRAPDSTRALRPTINP